MTAQTSWTRPAIDFGNRCRAGRALKTSARASGSMAARVGGVEGPAQPLLEVEGRPEGLLQRDLLVEDHADDQGQRVGGYQLVDCLVSCHPNHGDRLVAGFEQFDRDLIVVQLMTHELAAGGLGHPHDHLGVVCADGHVARAR